MHALVLTLQVTVGVMGVLAGQFAAAIFLGRCMAAGMGSDEAQHG